MNTEPEPEILYHYCSNDAFLKIVGGKRIWLSDLSLSNDSMEGKWERYIFFKYCREKGLPEADTNRLCVEFDRITESLGFAGFCLSELGDVLSQWRGYADDAAGVSIGFSRRYLEFAAHAEDQRRGIIVIHKAIYDENEQIAIISKIADTMMEYDASRLQSGSTNGVARIFLVYNIINMIYSFKNGAFSQEREWRLMVPFSKQAGEDGDLDDMQFRATHNRVIPYRTLELTPADHPAIKRVVLGPRNITPISVVGGFLAKHGHEDVEVVPSAASYR